MSRRLDTTHPIRLLYLYGYTRLGYSISQVENRYALSSSSRHCQQSKLAGVSNQNWQVPTWSAIKTGRCTACVRVNGPLATDGLRVLLNTQIRFTTSFHKSISHTTSACLASFAYIPLRRDHLSSVAVLPPSHVRFRCSVCCLPLSTNTHSHNHIAAHLDVPK